jgi:hypothetical protein
MPALYSYGVVPNPLDLSGAPAGLDGAPVRLEARGAVAALVSAIDADAYAPEHVSTQSQDVEWLGVRAAAHDRVITWASDRTAIIPLPLFTLYRDAAGVREMLDARQRELADMLARFAGSHEFTVRIFRLDAALTASLARRSPAVADLEARARDATPGQRYLLERKLEQARRVEMERIGDAVAAEAYAKLECVARAGVREPVSPRTGATAQAVLNASFLVADAASDAFRSAVTELLHAHGGTGFRIEFTGPWPPYHYVPSDGTLRIENATSRAEGAREPDGRTR